MIANRRFVPGPAKMTATRLQLWKAFARTLHVPFGDPLPHAIYERPEAGRVDNGRSEMHAAHVQVGRRWPVHLGDFHVAAERDNPDAVLDSLAPNADERRREADVEAARGHPHGPGGEEVPRLMNEHEQPEAEDRGEHVHVTAAPTARSA